MQIPLRTTAAMAALSAWAICAADVNFTNSTTGDTTVEGLSAITNTTSGVWGYGADYKVDLNFDGSSDLFLNNVTLTPAGAYTVPLQLASGTIGYRDHADWTDHTYTFGTQITNAATWTLDNVAFIDDAGAAAATVGTYDFSLNFIGGGSADATDVLGSLNCELVVVPNIDVTVTGATDPSNIHAGQTSHLSMTVGNNMQDRSFVTTTWFVSTWFNGKATLPFSGFDFGTGGPNWFNQTIDPNGSLTLGHSFWNADGSTALGTYAGNAGVVGGLFNGDWHWFNMSNNPSITVQAVPEPATTATLIVALAGLALRRRAKR